MAKYKSFENERRKLEKQWDKINQNEKDVSDLSKINTFQNPNTFFKSHYFFPILTDQLLDSDLVGS